MSRARVLVVDDKESIRGLLSKILGDAFEVSVAEDGTRALARIASEPFDVILSDIRMPGADGFMLLREAKRAVPDVEVVLMTAYGLVADAVEAIKQGAYDYLTKPFEPDEALLTVQRAAERKALRRQAQDLRAALLVGNRFENMVGTSPPMQKVFELMGRAAQTDSTVLVTGESGTGKELVARAIHYASARRERKFVPINCGAIPETLIESELFGHVKGSFTGAAFDRRGLFEEAEGGTLFLDEIGELPLPMQVKLSRVLQERAVRRIGASEERKVDVRVVAATNIDLKEAVSAGRFREDLFYRLNIFPIRLPPLRQRSEDIPMLAMLFLERHGAGRPTPLEGFTPEAFAALMRYDWPGNVRELENAVERAVAVSDGPRIELEALPEEVSAVGGRDPASDLTGLSYRDAVDLARDRASRQYLVALMKEFGGNVTAAAERAGMERESLHRLLKRYGVRSDSFKG